jgi:hypothetical protein
VALPSRAQESRYIRRRRRKRRRERRKNAGEEDRKRGRGEGQSQYARTAAQHATYDDVVGIGHGEGGRDDECRG